ncbi:MAG: acyl-[acyl-carrier-protein]-phospholipid O-acyltransferase / LCFA-[acyl-carrier-protein] ligase [Verrucomicrobia bacterium]|nr:MAG: acyl-[acyl-carrier-protein]-phospholipid O-acyltransferase / LCFA-[acyl-carrier-protein] ligase [Verrucomicrobiota bacterium]
MKTFFKILLRFLFRFEAFGTDSLKTPGPVILVANHVSWLDWLFLLVVLENDWRFVVSGIAAQGSWLHRKIMINRRTFVIDPASPYAAKHMAQYLKAGNRLVLFAEGRITFTGSLMKLFEGTGFLLAKVPATVVTCYIRGAERLKFSRHPGWRRWFPKISTHFSASLQAPVYPHLKFGAVRQAYTEWVRTKMVEQQFQTEMAFGPATVVEAIFDAALKTPTFHVLEDISQKPLSYRGLMISCEVLSAQLRAVLPPEPLVVGVLLPNMNVTPICLLALWANARTPVIFNFSSGIPTVTTCAKLARVQTVLTSRVFVEKARLDLCPLQEAGMKILYLEDLSKTAGISTKLVAAFNARFFPERILRIKPSSETAAVVLFTSGSEGSPKGVPLSHRNLLSNIRQMLSVTDINDTDRIFNALPLFHSFGLTVGMLLGLVRGASVFLYPSPLHYRMVPTVIYDKNCTVFLATNTFLNGYARRAHPYDFRSVRYLFAAAEKIQASTFDTWAQKYGVRILEGYGATECGPAISTNVPLAPKMGSAGRFLPGIEWKIEPIEGVSEGGRLLVRGPNVMSGYLKQETKAPQALPNGWYDTGDIVRVDQDGFLFILGRLKRFAKVSGEMISLGAIEDALSGAFPHHGPRCLIAVVSKPDPDKGETLIAVTNTPQLSREELRTAIRGRGLTNLWVPSQIRYLGQIPVLGSGKINHREILRVLAEDSLPLCPLGTQPGKST